MSSTQPTILDPETRRGRQYGQSADGRHWTRRVGLATSAPLTPWTAVEPVLPPASPSTLHLSVVMEHQAEGDVKHWSLFCHRLSAVGGRAWQVTGDAEFMVYNHEHDADKLGGEVFASCQVLNDDVSEAQLARVEEVVGEEKSMSLCDQSFS